MSAVPFRMNALPRDKHGRPVPWFVAWINGQPDHRIVDAGKPAEAVAGKRCWLCGNHLGAYAAFVIGPMCAVNRVSAEPPSHRDCAIYAATNCPFMTTPRMGRREGGKPDNLTDPAGTMIKRNPGVALVWITRSWRWTHRAEAGGHLAEFGDPTETLWYAEGRDATRAEVIASIDSGLELLRAEAEKDTDPAAALAELVIMHARALRLIPGDN